MFPASIALLLGIIWMVSGAAFVPIRQANPAASISSDCAPASITTVYVPTTLYFPPKTITIALENITSVSESLSSAASVDTAQVSIESELNPISEAFPPFSKFTHTIIVPLVEATIATNSSSGVYYVSIGKNTTNWSYTPTQSTVVGTTTVTVLPVPTRPSTSINSTTTISTTTRITHTTTRSGTAFSVATGGTFTGSAPYYPWANGTNSSTLFGGASGSGRPSKSYGTTITVHNTTVTKYTTVATTTISVTAYPTTISTANATQPTNLTSTGTESALGFSGTNATWENTYGKRQVCTLVYATISGNLASWCNNWDGHTVFHHSSYSSTLTPSQYATGTSSGATSSLPSSETTAAQSETPGISIMLGSVASPTQVPASILTTSPSSAFSAPATATSCGQVGAFEINFDDLPVYSPSNNDTASSPPIFNPYEHFFWGNGWAYGPPPSEPFPPESGDHLAEFVPSLANNETNNPDASTVPESAFGAGPRAYNNNYWFNPSSAWVGCDNGATDPAMICDFVATAYQWDSVNSIEKVVATEHFPQPPCPGFKNCTLSQIIFDSRFTMLSSLSFYANVQGQLKIFWIDTIEMNWWNNTCAAGLARVSAQ